MKGGEVDGKKIVVLDHLNYEGYKLPENVPEQIKKLPAAVLYLYMESEQPVAAAFLKAGGESVNPVYVSVGNRIDLTEAIQVVEHCSTVRVPEPIRLADKGGRVWVRNMSAGDKGEKTMMNKYL